MQAGVEEGCNVAFYLLVVHNSRIELLEYFSVL